METDSSKLLFALVFAFISPIVCYAAGMVWNKAVGAPAKVNRVWTSFCLLLPIVLLVMLVQVGFDTVRRVWITSPYFLSILAIVCGVLAPAALIAAIVRLWRTKPDQQPSR